MTDELPGIFQVLSDPTRLAIFKLLLNGEYCNCELNKETGLSINLLSHHLKILRESGLLNAVRDEKDTRWIHYSIDQKRFAVVRREIDSLFDGLKLEPRKSNCPPKH